jgi:NAD(P)-dependent dehydrogenase (short-subunit alcohol dehydrogenase family)
VQPYLVTGASSGIGRAAALHLAGRGHQVVAGVRRAADAPVHPLIRPVTLDVTDAGQLAAAAAGTGPLAGLVNSAGVTLAGPVEYLPLRRLREQLEVNVVGLVAATQAFLPAVRAGHGRVVMISSTAGRVATPLLGAYSASKFAVEAIAAVLRMELRPWAVPVIVIEPGAFRSQNRSAMLAALAADRAAMGAAAQQRYGRAMDSFARFSRDTEAGAADPGEVAAIVEHALTASCPQERYLAGDDARSLAELSSRLPARELGELLCQAMGLPATAKTGAA